MIFTIFIEFFGIFPEFKWIYFKFLSFKLIFKIAKRGYISRVYTWMRRGTQGHVALPRGHERLPAWRGCDVDTYYIYYLYLYSKVYSSSNYRKTKVLNLPFHLRLYTRESPEFLPCGIILLCVIWLQATWQPLVRRIDITWNTWRRCGGRAAHWSEIYARS